MSLKPWRRVVAPRWEVRDGRSFSPDEFAIGLEQVAAGTAPRDYGGPARFFARTVFTRALRDHAGMALRRPAGRTANTAAVLTRVTQFGGGKTHTLTARAFSRREANALATFCFLTKDSNLQIGAKPPAEYLPKRAPGAVQSQSIPDEPEPWKVENYRRFLEERRKLLATAANRNPERLLRGNSRWMDPPTAPARERPRREAVVVPGRIGSDEEEQSLRDLNGWILDQGLPPGNLSCELADTDTGEQRALLDLAWPTGVQAGLSQPVAVLLNEGDELVAFANAAGYRCSASVKSFRRHVETEIVSQPGAPG